MSLITEQVCELREFSKKIWGASINEVKDLMVKAADTIEELSKKLAAVNMERSTAFRNGGWIPAEERTPENPDEIVLILVSGKPRRNIWLNEAYELAQYDPEDGWIIWAYPEWRKPEVIKWLHMPER